MNYWFRPKRWGRWVAVYVPTSWQGWLVTLVLLTIGFIVFVKIQKDSIHWIGTFWAFLPWAITIMVLYDLACFRKGEYPWWWKKKN